MLESLSNFHSHGGPLYNAHSYRTTSSIILSAFWPKHACSLYLEVIQRAVNEISLLFHVFPLHPYQQFWEEGWGSKVCNQNTGLGNDYFTDDRIQQVPRIPLASSRDCPRSHVWGICISPFSSSLRYNVESECSAGHWLHLRLVCREWMTGMLTCTCSDGEEGHGHQSQLQGANLPPTVVTVPPRASWLHGADSLSIGRDRHSVSEFMRATTSQDCYRVKGAVT